MRRLKMTDEALVKLVEANSVLLSKCIELLEENNCLNQDFEYLKSVNKKSEEENTELKIKLDKVQTEIDRLKEQLEYSDISKVNTMALVQELSERKNVTFVRDSGRTLSGIEPQSEPRILIKTY